MGGQRERPLSDVRQIARTRFAGIVKQCPKTSTPFEHRVTFLMRGDLSGKSGRRSAFLNGCLDQGHVEADIPLLRGPCAIARCASTCQDCGRAIRYWTLGLWQSLGTHQSFLRGNSEGCIWRPKPGVTVLSLHDFKEYPTGKGP